MDGYEIWSYVWRTLVGIIITIIGICTSWVPLIVIGGGYLIFLVAWLLSDKIPPLGSLIALILCLGGTISFLITRNMEHLFGILFLVGMIKSHRLWCSVVIYDKYYSFFDDKFYDFVNEDSTIWARFLASLLCVLFYVLLMEPGYFLLSNSNWLGYPLMFLPSLFLLYRTIRLFLNQ